MEKVKRKQWSEVDMFHAMEDCGAGMAIRQAAKVHGVPRQTLADRLSGRVTHGCRSGPPTLLAPEDENSLMQYFIYCASHGFPFTRQRLMKYANKIRRFRHPGETIPPLGKRWWEMFRRRHKNLSMRRPDTLDRGSAKCATRPTMDTFFTSYEKHLEESGLREKPRQIYNCDESGFRSDQSRHKVLAPRGAKNTCTSRLLGPRSTSQCWPAPPSPPPHLSSTPSVSPVATTHWEAPPPKPWLH
ncbi:hypothetical protein J4Q44_G00022450 [Coregonus suidteri]|uniref:HTH CENPB-type domain-containing protein n=1 Tax=Coregonus suidteri TaxID=861788 RepID=A0AAN8R3U8_9TELE